MDLRAVLTFAALLNVAYTYDFPQSLSHLTRRATEAEQTEAAKGVIQRLIPDSAHLFNVEVDASIGPFSKATFKVVAGGGTVNITGTSGVAATWGFYTYLRQFCHCHVSWDADQLQLPDVLPDANFLLTSVDSIRYYQNVCTTSYSFAWWDWTRWEREIDWMALNGKNMALAFTGQEAIWDRVYRKFNLTQEDIDEYFVGPAFLAWGRMGNIRKWGGPLSASWHQMTLDLQHRILERMRVLGIIAVRPAFAGHVPPAIVRLYPEANVTRLGPWAGFGEDYSGLYVLEPTDDLFRMIGNEFLKELIAEFGTSNIYNCDTFNEMRPTSGNLTYLSAVSESIFRAMTDVDPNAVWMIQSWLFLDTEFWTYERAEALITPIPINRMIVLDLQSEFNPLYKKFNSFFGQPFIWCMLHNFGGTLGMHGAVEMVVEGILDGRSLINGTMIGTGLTPEGINQNYVVYDLVNEMALREELNLTSWFEFYAMTRYGSFNVNASNAWLLLKDSIYKFSGQFKLRGKYIICRRPSLRLKPTDSVYHQSNAYDMRNVVITQRPDLNLIEPMWYTVESINQAWDEILAASSQLNDVLTYQHDIVDITRQNLQVLASGYYLNMVTSYRKSDAASFQANSTEFLNVLGDIELILSSNKAFLLGPWINSAKALATSEQDESIFEYNARNQITLWGPNGEIRDYANKQWSGIVSNYFLPRWELFVNHLSSSLTSGVPFNQTLFDEEVFSQVEEPFTFDRTVFPDVPQGNSTAIALEIHARWRTSQGWSAVENFVNFYEFRPHVIKV